MKPAHKKLSPQDRKAAQHALITAATARTDLQRDMLRKGLPLIIRMIDESVADNAGALDLSTSEKDRLFDRLMIRLEMMQPYRAEITATTTTIRQTPELAYLQYRLLKNSFREMLKLIIIRPFSQLQEHILLGIYHQTFLKWERDETPELSNTMAFLNTTLNKLPWLSK